MTATNQIKCWFMVRGENGSTRGKTSHSRVENQQTQSTEQSTEQRGAAQAGHVFDVVPYLPKISRSRCLFNKEIVHKFKI